MTENKKQKMVYSIDLGPHAGGYGDPYIFIAYPDQGEEIADNLFGAGIDYEWYNDNDEVIVGNHAIDRSIMDNPEGYKKYYGWSDKELKANQKLVDDLCNAYWDTMGTVKEAMKSLRNAGLVDDYSETPYVEGKENYYAKAIYGWPDDNDVIDLTD